MIERTLFYFFFFSHLTSYRLLHGLTIQPTSSPLSFPSHIPTVLPTSSPSSLYPRTKDRDEDKIIHPRNYGSVSAETNEAETEDSEQLELRSNTIDSGKNSDEIDYIEKSKLLEEEARTLVNENYLLQGDIEKIISNGHKEEEEEEDENDGYDSNDYTNEDLKKRKKKTDGKKTSKKRLGQSGKAFLSDIEQGKQTEDSKINPSQSTTKSVKKGLSKTKKISKENSTADIEEKSESKETSGYLMKSSPKKSKKQPKESKEKKNKIFPSQHLTTKGNPENSPIDPSLLWHPSPLEGLLLRNSIGRGLMAIWYIIASLIHAFLPQLYIPLKFLFNNIEPFIFPRVHSHHTTRHSNQPDFSRMQPPSPEEEKRNKKLGSYISHSKSVRIRLKEMIDEDTNDDDDLDEFASDEGLLLAPLHRFAHVTPTFLQSYDLVPSSSNPSSRLKSPQHIGSPDVENKLLKKKVDPNIIERSDEDCSGRHDTNQEDGQKDVVKTEDDQVEESINGVEYSVNGSEKGEVDIRIKEDDSIEEESKLDTWKEPAYLMTNKSHRSQRSTKTQKATAKKGFKMKMPGLGSMRIPIDLKSISFDFRSASSSSGRGIYVPTSSEIMNGDHIMNDESYQGDEFSFSPASRSLTRKRLTKKRYKSRNRRISTGQNTKSPRMNSNSNLNNKKKRMNLSSPSSGRKRNEFRDEPNWYDEFD